MNDLLFRSQKMSDWLKKIRKERRKRFALFHEQIAILLTKNELLARKSKEKIPNPVHKYCIQLKFYATPSFFKKHNTMYRTKRGKPIIHNASPCSPVQPLCTVPRVVLENGGNYALYSAPLVSASQYHLISLICPVIINNH